MKQTIKGILFDVDGTLLDTTEYIYKAFEHAFRRHGLPAISRHDLAPLMGTPLEIVYERILPTIDPVVIAATHREFQRHNPDLIHAFPGVAEVLPQLHELRLKLAAITSRKEHVVESLEKEGIYKHFDLLLTSNDVQYHKPHPEGVLKALERLALKPSEAMMVGDMPPDIGAGKAAEVLTVGVTWGFVGPAIQQTHPDYIVNDMKTLISVVKELI